ncbi:hypothetical protein HDK90DRAFT_544508 [Phyllosticta capitalensis]|uniref:Uncharacterized protein n=1 Tax=Phyllosticta capitalensis TaxID=121624 RepID=A0ABR1YBZ0_9PEZI
MCGIFLAFLLSIGLKTLVASFPVSIHSTEELTTPSDEGGGHPTPLLNLKIEAASSSPNPSTSVPVPAHHLLRSETEREAHRLRPFLGTGLVIRWCGTRRPFLFPGEPGYEDSSAKTACEDCLRKPVRLFAQLTPTPVQVQSCRPLCTPIGPSSPALDLVETLPTQTLKTCSYVHCSMLKSLFSDGGKAFKVEGVRCTRRHHALLAAEKRESRHFGHERRLLPGWSCGKIKEDEYVRSPSIFKDPPPKGESKSLGVPHSQDTPMSARWTSFSMKSCHARTFDVVEVIPDQIHLFSSMEIHGLHKTYLFLLLVADHGHREEKTTIGHSILPPQPVVIAQSCGHKERQTLTQPMAKSSIISRCLLSPNLRALDPSTHPDDINAKWHPTSIWLDERQLEMAQPTNPDGYMRVDDYPLLRRRQPRLAQAAAGWLAGKGKWRWERTNQRQVQIVGRAPQVKPHENGVGQPEGHFPVVSDLKLPLSPELGG